MKKNTELQKINKELMKLEIELHSVNKIMLAKRSKVTSNKNDNFHSLATPTPDN